MKVLSTNIAHPQECSNEPFRLTGIDKRPANQLEVFIPGPSYGDGSGVKGDTVGDTKHHGGAQKAVYAFAREELDFWSQKLGRELSNGSFGENLTTGGIDWKQAVINQRFAVGSAVLEVSISRQPCRTFAEWLNQKGWVKTFTQHGDCGAYLRVITPGIIKPGDALEILHMPSHGITMGELFAASVRGDKAVARKLFEAQCLPQLYHERMAKLIGAV